ncbi:MAG TPA: hypothetical protein PLZ57_08375 [Pseudobdellovibrionaceae bacterium]|nr:hypothetical protein [Pseudobdellovibrionaceae bacterium]
MLWGAHGLAWAAAESSTESSEAAESAELPKAEETRLSKLWEESRHVPELTIRLKETKQLQSFMKQNSWFKQLEGTELWYGWSDRLGPALTALSGPSTESAWKGRLVDHLMTQVLGSRPLSIHVLRASRLASPFALSTSGLSATEAKALQAVVGVLRSADDVEVNFRERSGKVTPIKLQGQKYAIAQKDACWSVSRSPEAAWMAVEQCAQLAVQAPLQSDAEILLNLASAFPAFNGLQSRFVGTEPQVTWSLKFNTKDASWQIKSAQLKLDRERQILGRSAMPLAQLQMLPTQSTILTATLHLPPPASFEKAALATWMQTPPEKSRSAKTHLTATLAYILPQADAKEGPMPVLLLNWPGRDVAQAAKQLSSGVYAQGRVFVRSVCGQIAMSPQAAAFVALEAACAKKNASFAQLPQAKVKALSAASHAVAYAAPGRYAAWLVERGWRQTNAKKDVPAELRKSQTILERIPAQFFVGQVEKSERLNFGSVE